MIYEFHSAYVIQESVGASCFVYNISGRSEIR